jgi:hypothetical protein
MNVKGTAYIAGKVGLIEGFGEERWNSFVAKLAHKDKYFSQMIMSVTLIPVDKFALFLDEITKEFFNNDNKIYLIFGMSSAKYALSPGGPYHPYLMSKNLKYIVESVIPKLWSIYFDTGLLNAKLDNNVVHIKITGIPIKHVYFEYLITGYLQKGIKMFGKKAVENCIRGFSKGDTNIYYRYDLHDT